MKYICVVSLPFCLWLYQDQYRFLIADVNKELSDYRVSVREKESCAGSLGRRPVGRTPLSQFSRGQISFFEWQRKTLKFLYQSTSTQQQHQLLKHYTTLSFTMAAFDEIFDYVDRDTFSNISD